jgi:hypothetical protein
MSQMQNDIKLSDAIARLLSQDNKDKSLGEIGEDLSEYLVQIKELVERKEITYGGLMEEIYKYIDKDEIIKPNSVSQLLLGCVEGDQWCFFNSKDSEISFFYDTEKQSFVSLSGKDTPDDKDTYAVLFLSGDPRNIDIESFKNLEEKGFQKVKIRFKSVSDSEYREISIQDLVQYIQKNEKKNEQQTPNNNFFMTMSFLLVILAIVFYIGKQPRVKVKRVKKTKKN